MVSKDRLKWTRRLGAILVVALISVSACSSSSKKTTGGSSAPGTSSATSSAGTGTGSTAASSGGLPSPTTPLSTQQALAAITQVHGNVPIESGNTTRGVNGKVITLAGVADLTSGGQPDESGGCDGAKARIERADREGGINGYTFKYAGCTDDQTNPTTTTQAIQKAVTQDNAFALVPLTAATATPQYLASNHVPAFGFGAGEAYCGYGDAAWTFSPMGTVGCPLDSSHEFVSGYTIAGYTQAVKSKTPASDIKWAIVGSDSAFDKSVDDSLVSVAKQLGEQVVYNDVPIPGPTAPPLSDYTPVVQKVLAAKPTVINLSISGAAVFGLTGALRAAGYTGDIQGTGFNNAAVLANSSLKPVIEGVISANAWAGNSSFPGAGTTQIAADLKAIGSTESPNDIPTIWSYASADLFLSAFAKISGSPTTEKLANVLNGGFEYPGYSNLICSASFPAFHYAQSNCLSLTRIHDAKEEPLLPLGNYGELYLVKI
jgi:branched-chain amino acid transport system substrate-binding protein